MTRPTRLSNLGEWLWRGQGRTDGWIWLDMVCGYLWMTSHSWVIPRSSNYLFYNTLGAQALVPHLPQGARNGGTADGTAQGFRAHQVTNFQKSCWTPMSTDSGPLRSQLLWRGGPRCPRCGCGRIFNSRNQLLMYACSGKPYIYIDRYICILCIYISLCVCVWSYRCICCICINNDIYT